MSPLPQISHIFLMNNVYRQGCQFSLRASGFHTFLVAPPISFLPIDGPLGLEGIWLLKHDGYGIWKSNFGMKD